MDQLEVCPASGTQVPDEFRDDDLAFCPYHARGVVVHCNRKTGVYNRHRPAKTSMVDDVVAAWWPMDEQVKLARALIGVRRGY